MLHSVKKVRVISSKLKGFKALPRLIKDRELNMRKKDDSRMIISVASLNNDCEACSQIKIV